jgi:hypothetical protein
MSDSEQPTPQSVAAILGTILGECQAALDLSRTAVESAVQSLEIAQQGKPDPRLTALLVENLRIDLQRIASMRELFEHWSGPVREALMRLHAPGYEVH